MVTVEFLGPIGKEPVTLKADSLKEVARQLQQDPDIAKWLPQCAVAVNDTLVKDPDTPLKEGDRVSLLPPVCGG
ncbi:MAG: MoaD/ThiS family protein [Epsilonproteobacteria bacterium]|jgi:molybdopterin synthase sulfur carrier subunit|nr:MoaD/ThiS family protein [Campylobacterota bacterium]